MSFLNTEHAQLTFANLENCCNYRMKRKRALDNHLYHILCKYLCYATRQGKVRGVHVGKKKLEVS